MAAHCVAPVGASAPPTADDVMIAAEQGGEAVASGTVEMNQPFASRIRVWALLFVLMIVGGLQDSSPLGVALLASGTTGVLLTLILGLDTLVYRVRRTRGASEIELEDILRWFDELLAERWIVKGLCRLAFCILLALMLPTVLCAKLMLWIGEIMWILAPDIARRRSASDAGLRMGRVCGGLLNEYWMVWAWVVTGRVISK
jgi:hypothetical protein